MNSLRFPENSLVSNLQPLLHSMLGSVCLLGVICFAGCVGEQESLHEDDHELPAHWPSDMQQAAARIKGRLHSLTSRTLSDSNRESLIAELQDLVEWAPEIAADTDLSEPNWVPIYELSETIRKHMRAGDVDPTQFSSDFQKLAELLSEAHSSLPVSDQPLIDQPLSPLAPDEGDVQETGAGNSATAP